VRARELDERRGRDFHPATARLVGLRDERDGGMSLARDEARQDGYRERRRSEEDDAHADLEEEESGEWVDRKAVGISRGSPAVRACT